MTNKIVFVIGAARSGTHLVADTIVRNLPNVSYQNEINEFWRSFCKNNESDSMSLLDYDELELRRIKEAYIKLHDADKSFFIEKTASNCFRLDVLRKIFPDALFIHVIRNGRDVVQSVQRKILGDPRKITTGKASRVGFIERCKFLFTLIKKKLGQGVVSPVYYLKNGRSYFISILGILGLQKNDNWGPRFEGYQVARKSLSSFGYTTLQWRKSVEAVNDVFRDEDCENYLLLRYENIVYNPQITVGELIRFLGGDQSQVDCSHIQKTQPSPGNASSLSDSQENEFQKVAGDFSLKLGYE